MSHQVLLQLLNEPWVAAGAIGVAAAGLAFAAGRLLVGPAAAEPDWAAPETNPSAGPSSDERRVACRRGGNPVEVELLDPDDALPPQPAWVADRSLGGLCLEAEKPVPVGKLLKVKLRNAPAGVTPIAIEVKSCRADGPAYKLGCQFIKTPTFNVMLLFG